MRKLSSLVRRFRAPRSLEEALIVLFGEEQVWAHSSGGSAGRLLELIALENGWESTALLFEAARLMGIGCLTELALPTESLIRSSGHDAERLASVPALPQRAPSGQAPYLLAVSDPAAVAVAEYRSRRIDVALALESKLAAVWSRYFTLRDAQTALPESLSSELLEVLLRLITDAHELGAQEVYLGQPDSESYEFHIAGRGYRGPLAREIVDQLRRCSASPQEAVRSVPVGGHAVELVRISNDVEAPLRLTWKAGRGGECMVQPERSSLQPVEILLIEDDQRFASLLLPILSREGYLVRHERTSESALEALRSGRIRCSLIISDVHLPDLDGDELLSLLSRECPTLPVLMLTSDDSRHTQLALVRNGAAAYVRKQEDLQILLAWCRNLLRYRERLLGEINGALT